MDHDAHISFGAKSGTQPDRMHPSLSEDLLRSLLGAMPDMVWFKDPNGVFLGCNEAFETMSKVREADIVGKTDYELVNKDQADFFREQDRLAMASSTPRTNEEWVTVDATGERRLLETTKQTIRDASGRIAGVLGIARDITDRKLAEQALEQRLVALTRPVDNIDGVTFETLFNLDDIQRLQDEFADATGVAALITTPDGDPITKPSNFCPLCSDIIRSTEMGRQNCFRSDAALGELKKSGPTVRRCMSGGLWDAGAGISIGGHHVANWLIGQIRDESRAPETIRAYARTIGADEDEAAKAYMEATSMSREQFDRIAKVLFTLANQLSDIAYQNVQQARFINDRKKAETELAATKNYLSNIIDSMPSLLIGVDPDCRVTQWNMGAEKATRIAQEEAVGKPLADLLPHMKDHLEAVREAIRTRSAQCGSMHTKTAGGETVHEDITVYPLITNGVSGAVVRIDDVTARVRLEQMMVQSEKMMSVGGLAAGMAHEINNPLAGVLGYTYNIRKRIFGDLKKNKVVAEECGVSLEAIREYMDRRGVAQMLDGIHESGSRAANIVSNMLDFSRKSDKVQEQQDIATLLDATLDLAANDYNLKKYYDFRKIEIVREYDDGVPPVPCEGNEIQQVFLNLLKNGAEAMTEKQYATGGPRFVCRVRHRNDMVETVIEDNGPGIDAGLRKRIFEPFFTTKAVDKGTGLGLSVSYFIITDQHRGTLRVESEPGQWTRFIIQLPTGKEVPHGDDSHP